jgi:signal transduction histidine kinase
MRHIRQISTVLYALVLVLGGWTYVVWLLKQDHNTALESSHRRVGQFARGLGLQVEAMASDGLGAATVGAALMGNDLARSDANAALGRSLTGGGYVRALFVVDAAGMAMAQRPEENLTAITSSLQAELRESRDAVWAGPMVDAASGKAFPVARRATIRDREVWVGAWLGSRDFEEVYADFRNPHSFVALSTLDGVLLGRFPPQGPERGSSGIGNAVVQAQLRALPVHSTALLENTDPDSGRVFHYGAYRVAGLPLLAVVSRARDDALASWRARRDKTVWFTVLTTLVVLGFAVLLQIAFNRSLRNAQDLALARKAEVEAKESLANGLMLAQDAERRRLAGDLHDGVGQTLSLLRNQVLLLRRNTLPPQAQANAHMLLDLASEAIDDLRNVARSLRPMHLEEQGVTGALRTMLNRIRTSSGLELRSRVEEVDDVITGSDATHLYRIAQEAISNVIKHAEAESLSIEMIRDISMVELRVRDDGKGMPPDSSDSGGFGLLSIGERCRMLGATLEIVPNTPSGTSVLVRVPIRAPEEVRA